MGTSAGHPARHPGLRGIGRCWEHQAVAWCFAVACRVLGPGILATGDGGVRRSWGLGGAPVRERAGVVRAHQDRGHPRPSPPALPGPGRRIEVRGLGDAATSRERRSHSASACPAPRPSTAGPAVGAGTRAAVSQGCSSRFGEGLRGLFRPPTHPVSITQRANRSLRRGSCANGRSLSTARRNLNI